MSDDTTCDIFVTYIEPTSGGRTRQLNGFERNDLMVSTIEQRTDDGLDAVWKALANATRRQILDVLVDGPATTSELSAAFGGLSRFAVMQHLAVLEKADLVVPQKKGRSRFNHLNPVPIQQISDRWISRYHRPLAEALIDLKVSLESEIAESRAGRSTTNDSRGTGAST